MLTRRQALINIAATATAAAFRPATDVAAAAPVPVTPVTFRVPAGACDTHTYVFCDPTRFPYAPTSGYRHEPATPDDMRAVHRALDIERVVIIQPSAYGTDNRCTIDGVTQLGAGARAVAAIDDSFSEAMLDDLHASGVRGIRVASLQHPGVAHDRLGLLADLDR